MNLEEDFNNEIKNKLDSRTFEYSEASWEKANALIQDAQKKKKRRIFFYFLSAGVILIGTFLCFQYNFNKTDAPMAAKETTEVIKNATLAETDTHPLNSNAKTEHLDSNNDIENNWSEKEAKDKKTKQENNLKSNPAKSNVTINKVNKTISALPKNNITTEVNYSEQTKGKAEIQISSVSKTKNKSPVSKTTRDSIVKAEQIVVNENGKAVMEIKSIKTDSVTREKISETAKTELTFKDTVLSIPTNSIALEIKKDSAKQKIDNLQIYAFIGAAFTPGYVKQFSIKESVNPSVGIFIRKTLKPNLGIGIGLFYTLYGNIAENPKVFKNTTQDFGYKNETTEIKQSRLHYIKLPLMIDYSKGKNNFSVGAQFMYLVTGSSNVTTYKESYGLKADNSSKKVYGYINGFSSYDISVILGYRREITNKVSIQILLDFGFMDVKNNGYFNSTAFDRNKSLQLNLGYKLFSK